MGHRFLDRIQDYFLNFTLCCYRGGTEQIDHDDRLRQIGPELLQQTSKDVPFADISEAEQGGTLTIEQQLFQIANKFAIYSAIIESDHSRGSFLDRYIGIGRLARAEHGAKSTKFRIQ